MPNHVHAVVQPLDGFDLQGSFIRGSHILPSERTGCSAAEGAFWQAEYYDHLIRDENDLRHVLEYAWANPTVAGMEDWKWRWMDEKVFAAAIGVSDGLSRRHGLEARVTVEANAANVCGVGNAGVASDGTGFQPVPDSPEPQADPAFSYIKSRLGVDRVKTLRARVAVRLRQRRRRSTSNPTCPSRTTPCGSCRRRARRSSHYLTQTRGGAFVLFTSYKMLIDAANRLKPRLDELGLPLLVQGQGAPRKILLDRFRTTPNAVLFGTSSFWQGIDVQRRCAAERHHRQAPVRRPGRTRRRGAARRDQAGRRQRVHGIFRARSDHQVEAGVRAADPQQDGQAGSS